MHRKQLLNLFSLKWNPFTPDVPTDGLLATPAIERFCGRIEAMTHAGGFALITGDSGNGKSVALRLLEERLAGLPEVTVGTLTRPQSGVADFYRELGENFGVELRPHNRWAGFKALRARWKAHAEASRLRPVLLVDEAQEMAPAVLNELRILASGVFDVESYLAVILAGDRRLQDRFREPDLVPLGSRIRTRLVLDYATRDELEQVLTHALKQAGNVDLLTKTARETLIEHAAGNFRVLMTMAGELLMAAYENNVAQIDEKLYLEVFQPASSPKRPTKPRTRART